LGFDHFIPPYANTLGADIVQGVNYASGAAGIRNETGTHLVKSSFFNAIISILNFGTI